MPLPTTPMAKLLHILILEHSIQNIKNIYIFTTRSKRPNCGIKRKKIHHPLNFSIHQSHLHSKLPHTGIIERGYIFVHTQTSPVFQRRLFIYSGIPPIQLILSQTHRNLRPGHLRWVIIHWSPSCPLCIN